MIMTRRNLLEGGHQADFVLGDLLQLSNDLTSPLPLVTQHYWPASPQNALDYNGANAHCVTQLSCPPQSTCPQLTTLTPTFPINHNRNSQNLPMSNSMQQNSSLASMIFLNPYSFGNLDCDLGNNLGRNLGWHWG